MSTVYEENVSVFPELYMVGIASNFRAMFLQGIARTVSLSLHLHAVYNNGCQGHGWLPYSPAIGQIDTFSQRFRIRLHYINQ
jgi:hypothetical protein